MLRLAVLFLVIALAAGLVGFSGIAAASLSLAQILFFVFLVIFVITLVVGLARRV